VRREGIFLKTKTGRTPGCYPTQRPTKKTTKTKKTCEKRRTITKKFK
jgi:hypothetical protein